MSIDKDLYLNLPEEILLKSYDILFDDFGKNLPNNDKIYEIKSIIKGGTKPCRSFENWVNFVLFLNNNLK